MDCREHLTSDADPFRKSGHAADAQTNEPPDVSTRMGISLMVWRKLDGPLFSSFPCRKLVETRPARAPRKAINSRTQSLFWFVVPVS
jgi:hypothetical protein